MILIERASTMNEKQQKALLKALGNHSYSWIPDGSDEKTMRDLLQAAEASPCTSVDAPSDTHADSSTDEAASDALTILYLDGFDHDAVFTLYDKLNQAQIGPFECATATENNLDWTLAALKKEMLAEADYMRKYGELKERLSTIDLLRMQKDPTYQKFIFMVMSMAKEEEIEPVALEWMLYKFKEFDASR